MCQSRVGEITTDWALLKGQTIAGRAVDANGGHDFYTLLRNNVPLSFWCFDLLSLRGKDLRLLPLGTRRSRLRRLLPSGPLHFSEAFADPHALLQKAAQYRLEGIVSKRVDLPYRSGKRPEWVKVKAQWWREANSDRWEKMRGYAPPPRPCG